MISSRTDFKERLIQLDFPWLSYRGFRLCKNVNFSHRGFLYLITRPIRVHKKLSLVISMTKQTFSGIWGCELLTNCQIHRFFKSPSSVLSLSHRRGNVMETSGKICAAVCKNVLIHRLQIAKNLAQWAMGQGRKSCFTFWRSQREQFENVTLTNAVCTIWLELEIANILFTYDIDPKSQLF